MNRQYVMVAEKRETNQSLCRLAAREAAGGSRMPGLDYSQSCGVKSDASAILKMMSAGSLEPARLVRRHGQARLAQTPPASRRWTQ